MPRSHSDAVNSAVAHQEAIASSEAANFLDCDVQPITEITAIMPKRNTRSWPVTDASVGNGRAAEGGSPLSALHNGLLCRAVH